MGSELDRSPQAYTTDGSVPGTGFQNVWIDLDIFFGLDLNSSKSRLTNETWTITSLFQMGRFFFRSMLMTAQSDSSKH